MNYSMYLGFCLKRKTSLQSFRYVPVSQYISFRNLLMYTVDTRKGKILKC